MLATTPGDCFGFGNFHLFGAETRSFVRAVAKGLGL